MPGACAVRNCLKVGVTTNTSAHRRRGISRDSAESHSRSAGWVADPADLAAQHRVLVPEHQELGVLGHLTLGQHHQTAEQTANEQVDDREDHSAMISTRLAAQTRSSSRAPQDAARTRRIRIDLVSPGTPSRARSRGCFRVPADQASPLVLCGGVVWASS
jgi:hypothetical protein